jgi:uncharacterized protein (TIGR00730 family)
MAELKRVCVFCGSSRGTVPSFAAAAVSLGTTLAERNMELVYGGASVGLMGVIADAASAAGGRVTGVITESLSDHEIAHGGLARLDVVRTMHERKNRMAELSDAFVMLPGGFGTLEEFMEAVTWRQLAIHEKASGILNVDGYFADLLAFGLTPSRSDSSGRTTQPRSQSPMNRDSARFVGCRITPAMIAVG